MIRGVRAAYRRLRAPATPRDVEVDRDALFYALHEGCRTVSENEATDVIQHYLWRLATRREHS